MKPDKTKERQKKPLKRVYQPAGCVIPAKIKRLRAHLENFENDHAAATRLDELQRRRE